MIEEPQLSYLLEFLSQLGDAANYFILVGARAVRFTIDKTRPTKDFDFVLDVVTLRGMALSIAEVLENLRYNVEPQARNFQFVKEIPDSSEKIRIEFLASEKEKRAKDFRADVQKNIHARACTGAEIVLTESDYRQLKGVLPNGRPAEVQIRIARPHSLLMMKLFAMDDRYKNIRGPKEAKQDREEAQVHAVDIVAIVHHHIQNPDLSKSFWLQFANEVELRKRAENIITNYFGDLNSPGILLYAGFLRRQGVDIDETQELRRALREVRLLLPHSVS